MRIDRRKFLRGALGGAGALMLTRSGLSKVLEDKMGHSRLDLNIDGFPVHGIVASGFDQVAEAFVRNFEQGLEIGSATAAYRDDEILFDLWGGFKDEELGEPWESDTMACVHSSTKAIAALAIAMALSRGYLELDRPVADYWPEFGVNGKEGITVRQILDHSAGLPIIEEQLSIAIMADLDALSVILARQSPQWEPGTRHGYHGWTFGMYLNEIMRRTDPESRTIGRFVQDEIFDLLNEEFYIGLPDHIDDSRISGGFMTGRTMWEMFAWSPMVATSILLPKWMKGDSLGSKMLYNPPELGTVSNFHRRDVRRVEIPGGNGIGTARAMARAMAASLAENNPLQISPEVQAEIEKTHPKSDLNELDAVMGIPMLFQMGFAKPTPQSQYGSRPRTYFHSGGGANLCLADPDSGVGFGYCLNRFGGNSRGDPRVTGLYDALLDCLG